MCGTVPKHLKLFHGKSNVGSSKQQIFKAQEAVMIKSSSKTAVLYNGVFLH